MKLLSKIATLTVVLALILQCVFFSASAVSFSGGKGTKSDPYIVTTAEQLNNIRKDLSAHYKLGATIDMASLGNFAPIGTLSTPFKGSFVCELNSDNTPKYIIKNLKVYVEETEYIAEKVNKWEAALFGAATNADFKGIYLADINVSCQVLGDNRGAVIYNNYKPGMDEMNQGALIGEANGCSIKNCASTGIIDGRGSGTGGLIGRAFECDIKDCYSAVDVKTEGKWSVGGFIGDVNDSFIERCFSTGDVAGGQTFTSAFIGSIGGGGITNCYATGNVSGTAYQGLSAFAGNESNILPTTENVFALGEVKVANESDSESLITGENCWALSGKKHNLVNFNEGSLSDIKAAFKGLENWDTSGEYPTLTTIGVVKDFSAYKVGVSQESTTSSQSKDTNTSQSQSSSASNSSTLAQSSKNEATSSQNQGNNTVSKVESASSSTTSGNSTNETQSSSESQDSDAQQEESSPDDALTQISEHLTSVPDSVDDVTIEHKEAIKNAKKLYDNLDDSQLSEISADDLRKLLTSYEALCPLLLDDLTDRLQDIDPEKVTVKDKETILAIKDDFEFLSEEMQGYVAPKLKEKYDSLIKELEAMGDSEETASGSLSLTATETAIVIVLFALIAIIIAVNVLLIILIVKKYKTLSATEEDID